jgi:hypothetical protein
MRLPYNPKGCDEFCSLLTRPICCDRYSPYRSVGFEVIPYLSPLPSNWAYTKKSFKVFSEYVGLIKYAFQGWFLQQRPPELSSQEDASWNRGSLPYHPRTGKTGYPCTLCSSATSRSLT